MHDTARGVPHFLTWAIQEEVDDIFAAPCVLPRAASSERARGPQPAAASNGAADPKSSEKAALP